MLTPGTVSYLAAGSAFLVLTILLVTSWRGRMQGAVLVAAAFLNTLWAFALAYEAAYKSSSLLLVLIIEVIHSAVWIIFLLTLIDAVRGGKTPYLLRLVFYGLLAGVSGVIFVPALSDLVGGIKGIFIPVMLVLAVTGLVLVEQVYRNTRSDYRWAVKYLCIGLGGLFAYDLFLYSQALLFLSVDQDLWDIRGVVSALAVPLIAVAAARNPAWSLDVFVSRKVVFYATGLIGIGLYLLAMSVAGYYISFFGGDWSTFAQATFLSGAVLVLLIILFSGQSRARLKVFLSKHFYNYKYDYREEWRRTIRTLSSPGEYTPLRERTIKAVAQIVESPGGSIWVNQEGLGFVQVSSWNFPELDSAIESVDSSLICFLQDKKWIIDVGEYRRDPVEYKGLLLADWLVELPSVWLIIPLVHEERLLGFMTLATPRTPMNMTWEDYDILKMVGSQVASYLAQYEADQQLSRSRQFEAYSRLTAFIMHDLKNLIHQQSLIVKNAAKHRNNAAFVESAFETVDNSVRKMKRLLEQLQRGDSRGSARCVEVSELLEEVARTCSDSQPAPDFEVLNNVRVSVEPERMALVMEHLIRNAQDATPADGFVRIRLKSENRYAVIEVRDNGCGMDYKFTRNRLFEPFDSTKGSKGMGIGVFQTREFARSNGGDLTVTSSEGEGTTFRLILPEYYADAS